MQACEGEGIQTSTSMSLSVTSLVHVPSEVAESVLSSVSEGGLNLADGKGLS